MLSWFFECLSDGLMVMSSAERNSLKINNFPCLSNEDDREQRNSSLLVDESVALEEFFFLLFRGSKLGSLNLILVEF